jgi:hypothetical protein
LQESVPLDKDAAIITWIKGQGWGDATYVRAKIDPGFGFHVWRGRDPNSGKAVRLEIGDMTLRALSAHDLGQVLTELRVAEELRSGGRARVGKRMANTGCSRCRTGSR